MQGISGKAGNLAPLGIGLTVGVSIMFFGPLTGASLNPARTIGPAVAAGIFSDIWVYIVATIIGGVLAGLLYRSLPGRGLIQSGNHIHTDTRADRDSGRLFRVCSRAARNFPSWEIVPKQDRNFPNLM